MVNARTAKKIISRRVSLFDLIKCENNGNISEGKIITDVFMKCKDGYKQVGTVKSTATGEACAWKTEIYAGKDKKPVSDMTREYGIGSIEAGILMDNYSKGQKYVPNAHDEALSDLFDGLYQVMHSK